MTFSFGFSLAVAFLLAIAHSGHAQRSQKKSKKTPVVISYDQEVTQAAGNQAQLIAGTGINNGAFTVARKGCLELGLRGKVRNPAPLNTFNSVGNGNYNFDAGIFSSTGRAQWSFEFSINTDTCCNSASSSCRAINTYDYELCLDANPAVGGQTWQCGNIVNGDVPGGYFCPDHALGDFTTPPNQGSAATATCTPLSDDSSYRTKIGTKHILQQSWQYAFFPKMGWNFNPCAVGTYDIYLRAINKTTKKVEATVSIKIVTTLPTTGPTAGC